MSIRQGSNYIAGGSSQVNVDNLTINKNASNEIQAVSLINQNDPNANIKLWLGSEEDYEAVETKDENTVYFTKDGVIDISGEGSGGLEIGDIGIAPFGIDESLNKRRYLNGQVISQSQFVSFTNRIKAVIQLNPNLAATEENWQAEVTNSVLGQCGKFVIDDELGTIRLPKVVNIQGLQDLALIGNIKAESLPNITGNVRKICEEYTANGNLANGAFDGYTDEAGTSFTSSDSNAVGSFNFDASRSSSAYQDGAPVQQEAIQYPYFIQVATGIEKSVDVTREIELNNPFFLGMSQYFESEPNNASWLISNGTFHSGATYVSFYEWLLKIYNGTETVEGVSVKASTDTYDDYDYVINTADATFRLPLLDGSESVLSDKYDDLTLDASGTEYTAPANGWYTIRNDSTNNGYCAVENITTGLSAASQSVINCLTVYCNKGDTIKVAYTANVFYFFRFFYAQGNGSLYFYVGETIQDANVIAASQVLTTIADCVRKSSATDRETVVGWGMPDYNNGVAVNIPLESTNTTWEAPSNGYLSILVSGPYMNHYVLKANGNKIWQSGDDINSNTKWAGAIIPVKKGVQLNYSSDTGSTFETIATTFYAV